MMAPPKRRVLNLKEKIDILQYVENSKNPKECSVRCLANKYKLGKSCIANLLKNREHLLSAWRSGSNEDMKRQFLKPQGNEIDVLTYQWFTQVRAKNIPVSGPLIKEKALEFAGKTGRSEFKASNGWLQRFLIRHSISFRTISGEAADVNPETVASWAARIGSLIHQYDDRDIFNADETGLFFRALPNKTFSLKGETCSGGKASKERITILHCANMAGEKENLLVIGKAANPRCFKNVDKNRLPIAWKWNKKAWMTLDIMTEWLKNFNDKMKKQSRKVLIFLDNAASHPHLTLSNVNIVFLPPNTTSVCQPLDQGVIKNFKVFYRQLFLRHLIAKMGETSSATNLSSTVNVLDAITWANAAWRQISTECITNCFKKCGYVRIPENNRQDDFDAEDDLPLSCWANLSSLIRQSGCAEIIAPMAYAECDSNLCTNEDWKDMRCEEVIIQAETVDSASDEETEGEQNIDSYKKALLVCEDLRSFALRTGDDHALETTSNLRSHYEHQIVSGNFVKVKF